MPIERKCSICKKPILSWSTTQNKCYDCLKAASKPQQRKRINTIGKKTVRWFDTRKEWFKLNPPNENGFWECYLRISEFCIPLLDELTVTLDHVVGRGRDSTKKYDLNNLRPACVFCNGLKGSQSLEQINKKYGKDIK